MNRATATAAPSKVEIAGKTYIFTPIQDLDWGVFEKWLQDRMVDVATRNLAKIPADARQAFLEHAYDSACVLGYADPVAIKVMNSFEGACFLAWLSLRHEQPDITEDDVAKLLFSPEALGKAMDNLPLGVPDDAGKKKRPARTAARKKKKAARQSRGKGKRKT